MKLSVVVTQAGSVIINKTIDAINVLPVTQESNAIEKSIITAKGDLIAGIGKLLYDNHAVGTNGLILAADSSSSTGLTWVPASTGAIFDLTNNDAVTHAVGTVVIRDSSIDIGCKKTTTAGDANVIAVAVESVAASGTGKYMQSGQTTVLVQGNVSRGDWLVCSTTSGRAYSVGNKRPASGGIGIAQTAYAGGGAGSVTAIIDVELI
jgi:hypothetical protein